MGRVQHKGDVIAPAPQQLRDRSRWTMSLYIQKDSEGAFREKHFTAGNTFATQEEAALHCIILGRRIIDGESQNCTLDDL